MNKISQRYIHVLCRIHLSKLFAFSRESTLLELRQEASTRQETIAKLHSEREDLMQKIQAGEGTSAALQQLQEQNVIHFFTNYGSVQSQSTLSIHYLLYFYE